MLTNNEIHRLRSFKCFMVIAAILEMVPGSLHNSERSCPQVVTYIIRTQSSEQFRRRDRLYGHGDLLGCRFPIIFVKVKVFVSRMLRNFLLLPYSVGVL